MIRRDAFGHLMLADIQLGRMLCTVVSERLAARELPTQFNEVTLGYELRCADPVPFDIEYTRDLGFAAIRFLIEGGSAGMVMVVNGKRKSVPFHEMRDPVSGKTIVRNVDIKSEGYLVARRYMQRLTAKDFDSREELAVLAEAAHCTIEEFVSYFGSLVENEPEMFSWNDDIRDALGHG